MLHRTLKLENVYCCRSATESRGGAGDARGLAPWELLIVSAQKSFVLGAESAEAAAAWRDVISDAASKRRAALATKDAPPRAVKAFVKRGAETRATDFDIVGLADDLVARPSGARRSLDGPKISHTSHTLAQSKTMPLPRPPRRSPPPIQNFSAPTRSTTPRAPGPARLPHLPATPSPTGSSRHFPISACGAARSAPPVSLATPAPRPFSEGPDPSCSRRRSTNGRRRVRRTRRRGRAS